MCSFVQNQMSLNPYFPATGERWCPSDKPGGRFGSSIAPLGDINEDGSEGIE